MSQPQKMNYAPRSNNGSRNVKGGFTNNQSAKRLLPEGGSMCHWLLFFGLIFLVLAIGYVLVKWCRSKPKIMPLQPPRYGDGYSASRTLRECDAAYFANAIASGKESCVIAFVAPWCGFCKQMKPSLQTAAAQSAIPIMTITSQGDQPWIKNLLAKYNIRGFPTILKFVGGQANTYSGDRSVDSIIAFAAA